MTLTMATTSWFCCAVHFSLIVIPCRDVHATFRTKVCDPAFTDVNYTHIEEIPTKAYADLIFRNLTDVRPYFNSMRMLIIG